MKVLFDPIACPVCGQPVARAWDSRAWFLPHDHAGRRCPASGLSLDLARIVADRPRRVALEIQ